MLVIGLTGGIACGKSTLSNALGEIGVPIIDADAVSRKLTAPGGAALPEIRRVFGEGLFDEQGFLDRKALADIIFIAPDKRLTLNGIIHPLVEAEMERQTNAYRDHNIPAAVWDVPLLFEAGMNRHCDVTWCAYIPQRMQVDRLRQRDGLTHRQAMARIKSQMPLRDKCRLADAVIDTRGTVSQSAAIIRTLYYQAIEN